MSGYALQSPRDKEEISCRAGRNVKLLGVCVQHIGLSNGFALCGRLCGIVLTRLLGAVAANGCKHIRILISGYRKLHRFSIGHTGDISLHIGSECGDLRISQAAQNFIGGMTVGIVLTDRNNSVLRHHLTQPKIAGGGFRTVVPDLQDCRLDVLLATQNGLLCFSLCIACEQERGVSKGNPQHNRGVVCVALGIDCQNFAFRASQRKGIVLLGNCQRNTVFFNSFLEILECLGIVSGDGSMKAFFAKSDDEDFCSPACEANYERENGK